MTATPLSDERDYYYGYYFSLSKTGCEKIDAILKMIARAAKGAHHTESWSEFNYDLLIQEAASKAAQHIDHIQAENERLRELLFNLHSTAPHPSIGFGSPSIPKVTAEALLAEYKKAYAAVTIADLTTTPPTAAESEANNG